MERRMETVKRQLCNKFYHMNDEWLNDCLDYYLTENPNATVDEALTFVTAQWQLSDLREISDKKGCLPKNLGQQKCTTLPGKYILQVEKGYDISTPKYKQLETMRKVSNENDLVQEGEQTQFWEAKSKRMMQLFLTDGIQDISGIEYHRIRFLKDMILPGFKIMIKGPVECRRGVILLDESNIQEIGGEVERLLISNATENVFARALNMPENPDPYNDTNPPTGDAGILDDDFDVDLDVDLDEITQLESGAPANRPSANPPQSSRPQKTNSCINSSNVPTKNPTRSIDRPKPLDLETEMEGIEFPDDDELFLELMDENHIKRNSRLVENRQNENLSRNSGTSIAKSNNRESELINISNEKSFAKNLRDSSSKSRQTEVFDEKLEDFGNIEWDDFELEADVKTVQTRGTTAERNPEVSKSVKPTGLISFFKQSTVSRSEKNMKPLETTKTSGVRVLGASGSDSRVNSSLNPPKRAGDPLPTGSKILSTKNNAKITQNNRGILDFFKKTEKPVERPIERVCDFICELKRLSLSEGLARKKIWAKTKYLGKLGKVEGEWTLEGTLTDGTDSLDVEFSSKVLEKTLGFTVAEFTVQKKQKKD
uniref:RecQ-mediated genome instability protein 1 n=1 Tax=Fopius arisanus TaxID=64838 RepID=A0A0C9R6I6_9HYME